MLNFISSSNILCCILQILCVINPTCIKFIHVHWRGVLHGLGGLNVLQTLEIIYTSINRPINHVNNASTEFEPRKPLGWRGSHTFAPKSFCSSCYVGEYPNFIGRNLKKRHCKAGQSCCMMILNLEACLCTKGGCACTKCYLPF